MSTASEINEDDFNLLLIGAFNIPPTPSYGFLSRLGWCTTYAYSVFYRTQRSLPRKPAFLFSNNLDRFVFFFSPEMASAGLSLRLLESGRLPSNVCASQSLELLQPSPSDNRAVRVTQPFRWCLAVWMFNNMVRNQWDLKP